MRKLLFGLSAPLCVAVAALTVSADNAAAQNQVIEDTNKQLGRQISDSIARRTSVRLTTEAVGAAVAGGTTSDKNSSVWFNGTYNNLSADPSFAFEGDNVSLDADLDLYQATTGLDHRFGKFFAGISGSYTRAEFSATVTSPGIANLDSGDVAAIAGTSGISASAAGSTISVSGGANNYSVNPYVGYMITNYLYPLAILGYTRTELDDSNRLLDVSSGNGLRLKA